MIVSENDWLNYIKLVDGTGKLQIPLDCGNIPKICQYHALASTTAFTLFDLAFDVFWDRDKSSCVNYKILGVFARPIFDVLPQFSDVHSIAWLVKLKFISRLEMLIDKISCTY